MLIAICAPSGVKRGGWYASRASSRAPDPSADATYAVADPIAAPTPARREYVISFESGDQAALLVR
jgi:hypothetical protein